MVLFEFMSWMDFSHAHFEFGSCLVLVEAWALFDMMIYTCLRSWIHVLVEFSFDFMSYVTTTILALGNVKILLRKAYLRRQRVSATEDFASPRRRRRYAANSI
ncbi:hypothetical protein Dimus_038394 [Dionaea muscipula]